MIIRNADAVSSFPAFLNASLQRWDTRLSCVVPRAIVVRSHRYHRFVDTSAVFHAGFEPALLRFTVVRKRVARRGQSRADRLARVRVEAIRVSNRPAMVGVATLSRRFWLLSRLRQPYHKSVWESLTVSFRCFQDAFSVRTVLYSGTVRSFTAL